MTQGILYGIGTGPGDPELLTIKALRLLRETPVIFAPCKSAGEPSLAGRIVCETDQTLRNKIRELIFPMSADESELEKAWQQAAVEVRTELDRGTDCAFITEGDPFLYGSFIYLYEKLVSGTSRRIEVIPGISSITAAPARAGQPLARGDEPLAIVPAPSDKSEIKRILSMFPSIVFMKINPVFETLREAVAEEGLTDRATVIIKATTAEERIVRDIRELDGSKPGYFSLMLVRR